MAKTAERQEKMFTKQLADAKQQIAELEAELEQQRQQLQQEQEETPHGAGGDGGGAEHAELLAEMLKRSESRRSDAEAALQVGATI